MLQQLLSQVCRLAQTRTTNSIYISRKHKCKRDCRRAAAAPGCGCACWSVGRERSGVRVSSFIVITCVATLATQERLTMRRYLHHAARAGCIGCARVLIWGDATANSASECGVSQGLECSRPAPAGPLLSAVDARDRWFRTPLQWAVRDRKSVV